MLGVQKTLLSFYLGGRERALCDLVVEYAGENGVPEGQLKAFIEASSKADFMRLAVQFLN